VSRTRSGQTLRSGVSLGQRIDFTTDVTGRRLYLVDFTTDVTGRRLYLVVMLEPRSGAAEVDESRRSSGRSGPVSKCFQSDPLCCSIHMTIGRWTGTCQLMCRLPLLLLLLLLIMMRVLGVEVGRPHQ